MSARVPPGRSRRGRARAVGALVLALAAACQATPTTAPSVGHTWFVSRLGDDTTGTSWATAWNELDRIKWARVRPGDRIVLDGGSTRCTSNQLPTSRPEGAHGIRCGMTYRTPLVVHASGTAARPISIRLATSTGRDGTVLVSGGRSTPLPYCDQRRYHALGTSRSAGIVLPGTRHVVVDGTHRSGIMVYGAQTGVDLHSDRTGFVTLRNLEVFDNGTFRRWAHGYESDGKGVALAGHDVVIDRDLIHDNGQDEIQDTYTGVRHIEHAPLHDIRVTNSWLYERRANPLFPGFGFNAGAQAIAAQDCTHVDGLQIFGGGLDQRDLTFRHDVFGPLLAQGIYPGDADVASTDHVTVADVLFLNPLDHAIIGDPVASKPGTPRGWRIEHVTSYMTARPAPGLLDHGKVDLAGSRQSVRNSIFVNGYFADDSSFTSKGGNVWWGGEAVPGGTHRNPGFRGPVPRTNRPSYRALVTMNLTPTCRGCRGKGASLHDPGDLLARIDRLDRR